MENKFAEYGCLLKIYTMEEDPQIINELTGVCGEIVKKGLPKINSKTGKKNSTFNNVENIWKLDSKYHDDDFNMEKPLNNILDIILNNNFKEVFLKYNYNLICYAYIERYNIYFNLSPQTFQKLNKSGIKLTFDLYTFDDDD